jgi:2-polyprenyl-3-methyl-5-hydroxy-6-metoxy-1,4-benzoquinol methylase
MTTHEDRRDYWNERYTTQGLMWGIEANRFVAAELAGLAPRRVLDLGCGQGRNSIWLAEHGHRVTGVDVSDVAIAQARELARDAGVDVEFLARDLTEWVAPAGEYDLVVLSYLHLPEAMRRAVHASAVRALAPGGRLFLIAHHKDNLEHGIGGPQSLDHLYDEAELADDFAALDIVRNETVIRPAEKDGLSGEAIDVMLVADKPAE